MPAANAGPSGCGPLPAEDLSSPLTEEAKEDSDSRGICVAVCSVLVSIPALIGSCCWPILVGAIFAIGSEGISGKVVDMFHAIQLAVTFGIMSNIVQFAWWTCKRTRSGSHWARLGPVYILVLATVLVMVQPTYFVVQGAYHWKNAFIHNTGGKYNFLFPNTLLGWMVQIFCTYLGYILMFTGVCQATQIHTKIGRKFRAARRAPVRPQAGAGLGA